MTSPFSYKHPNIFHFPDLPTLLVDCAKYPRELAVDEPELDEVGAEDRDGGDRPFVHLVNVYQMQRPQPVAHHLQRMKHRSKLGVGKAGSDQEKELFHAMSMSVYNLPQEVR